METTTAPTQAKSDKFITGYFGDGRYSPAMNEVYKDSKRLLGLSDRQAHAVAARLGIDVGRALSGTAKVTISRALSKDGKRTVKDLVSLKLTTSWAMDIAVICVGLDELRKQGLDAVENSISETHLAAVNEAAAKLPKD